jgi:peptidoglycan/LPS O-acetylase OafA/YrhL
MVKAPSASVRSAALDGYRALAILVVMLAHVRWEDGYPEWLRATDPFVRGGVTAFMVLSGYLITRSLLSSEAKTGRIDILTFLGKQAVRFYVPLIGYLGVVLAIWGREPQFNLTAALRVLWLDPWTGDLRDRTSELTLHLYSLAAQMQFCLWWPVVLRFLPASRRFATVTVLMLLAAAWRILGRELAIANGTTILRTDYIFGSLMVGSWWAVAAHYQRLNWVLRRTGPRMAVVVVVALMVLAVTRSPSAFLSLISPELRDLVQPWRQAIPVVVGIRLVASLAALMSFGCLVFLLQQHRPTRLANFLASPALTWLGRISFSVYLWQSVFCSGSSGTFLDRFPWNIIASITCGFIAFHLWEKPSLKWRDNVKQWLQQRNASKQVAAQLPVERQCSHDRR